MTRRRRGSGFTYHGADGGRVTDPETLERIETLRIPPAWQDVWICLLPNGHLQALGTDEAGRRQYLYHEDWRLRRDKEKYHRAQGLGAGLPQLRSRLQATLSEGSGLTQERVLAAAVRLVDLGLFRNGNDEYVRANGSFGLSTALREHVTVRKDSVEICFQAKSGVLFTQEIHDPGVVEVVRALVRRKDPHPELLGWWDGDARAWRDVRSDHVNAYLREVSRRDVTVKDFRTWHASVLMAMRLSTLDQPTSQSKRQKLLAGTYREVAGVLHNTPAVTRSSYVDPRVIDLWEAGRRIPPSPPPSEAVELVPLRSSRALTRLLRAG
ncbi:MAG TPA: DNA topoisomerase IB [Mycobacteriales bacterium]|nr:DNA topoisomerase IB [Mycobacteriales bacterium]